MPLSPDCKEIGVDDVPFELDGVFSNKEAAKLAFLGMDAESSWSFVTDPCFDPYEDSSPISYGWRRIAQFEGVDGLQELWVRSKGFKATGGIIVDDF